MAVTDEKLNSQLSNRTLACPAQGKWTRFQLVDEFGSGEPFEGLVYEAIDAEGQKYRGRLDATGSGKVENHFAGPVVLTVDQKYQGQDKAYTKLQLRDSYPLKITELQVRAEQTRYRNKNATRPVDNPAFACADTHYQVEVRHLVEHVSHLPPEVYRHFPHSMGAARLMGEHGRCGVPLIPQQHTVLEVRPLRALRPLLSTGPEFCALNLYQLALMACLVYCPFGQQPNERPIKQPRVNFPGQPSVGNWFGDALAKADEIWQVDAGQPNDYYPLYEDVPYSKRLEIVPFDPALYAVNDPKLGQDQENPEGIHFLDDRGQDVDTDTQAFITHNDELILVSIRGTWELPADIFRDADALQVPFEEGVGHVHQGFYGAAQSAYGFVVKYLEKFHTGQKLLICGHSLGGAVALLLSEMLRRRAGFNYDIVLYTYGSPRAGDAEFVKGAAALVHYRMVNHNDPVPSLPGSWMNTKNEVMGTGLALTFTNVPLGVSVFVAGLSNVTGEPYTHHGTLRHFMTVEFDAREHSAILWEPGCTTIDQHAACSIALKQHKGLPQRPSLLKQVFSGGDHSMSSSYMPASWATLRRWQQAEQHRNSVLTKREFQWVDNALVKITAQLKAAERNLDNRPEPYVRAFEKDYAAIRRELDNIRTTHARLETLRFASIYRHDLYGSLSVQPERLAESLARWQAHPRNQAKEQLAMAPALDADDALMASLYGTDPREPYIFDIDSLT
ncbi:Lipase (class 3) [Pseudomonas sp. ok272]|uniref:lipase family protein n=1 Tax=unclassified Pseudomonas TaxID=196821 RepID=UPI0008C4EE36|nr:MULTISPECIES: lipase family protein [unclassified Pseudomonas]SEN41988.1 Lipase (class 3) [Pseudomonas sp. ok272]SFN26405.1 Lipase (class 3) [Pseudomonas sp. ok602]